MRHLLLVLTIMLFKLISSQLAFAALLAAQNAPLPVTTSSTSAGSKPTRSCSVESTWARIRWGCRCDRLPLPFLPMPRGERTPSMIHAWRTSSPLPRRRDPTGGVGEKYAPHPGGYENAADLVSGIKRIADIEVSVSAYPEKHPDSPSVDADIDMLKAKVDAGATRAITQFFFENDLYFRYLDKVRARGIDVPVVPGILPVQNFKQTKSFAARCGASVPAWLAERFDGLDEDVATRKLIAAAVAAGAV